MEKANSELKKEISSSFVEQQNVYLATANKDQPKVRPVTLIHAKNRLFVATSTNDAKVKQIMQIPKTEFCLLLEKGEAKGTLRAECMATIVKDMKIKSELHEKIPFMKEFWKTPSDPAYALIEFQPSTFEYMKPGTMAAVKVKA
jgi:uncharacterized pyridoxamine 5'-phosphate oxidase family protein